jgi:hypothetical protein
MQRRDPKGFLEGVMADVPDLSPETKEQLLGIVGDKVGTKRAARIAAILAGLEAYSPPAAVAAAPARAADKEKEKEKAEEEEAAPPAPIPPTMPPVEAAVAAPPPPAPAPTAKPKRSRSKKAAAPPPPAKGNLNPFAGEVGDDEEGT